MNELINLTIDGYQVQVPKETTIFEAAKKININIPHLCYHESLSIYGACRVCVVEIEGRPRLEPSCATLVEEGMKVKTNTTRVKCTEPADIRREVIPLGVIQTDASTRIGIGAYSEEYNHQEAERQQFLLGDTRSLDELIRKLALNGQITSFCTAGYRCGRTGTRIMDLLKTGKERWFCKLNAVLTFREWIDDFASRETKTAREKVIQKEIAEIKEKLPEVFPKFVELYKRIKHGEKDLYF